MVYRVQLSSEEPEEECDEATLFQWVETGRLLANHMIWDTASAAWVLAKDHPLLSNIFSKALWDAWAVDDDWELDPNIETGIRRQIKLSRKEYSQEDTYPQKKKYKTIPLSAITPLETTSNQEASLGDNPKQNPRKESSTPYISSSKSQLPNFEPKKTSVTEFWQPELSIKDQQQFWVKEEKKKTFSVVRIGVMVMPFFLLFLCVRWYIVSEASAIFPLETELDKVPDDKTEDVLLDLEAKIRGSLRNDTQIVSPSSSLSDALRIDLEYSNLDIQFINAKVMSWKGRLLQDPREAKITISIFSDGEADREIATISMIVAKYTERYLINMEKFTVVFQLEEGAFQKDIAVMDARNLLLQPGSLEKFLNTVMQ
jgi:hypothetical protein